MKSSQAQAAAAIKKDLKKHFPNIKFKVKSERFAGGNSVDVSWVNGPVVSFIDDIIKKYQYGSFNSMEDMYEYNNTNDAIPQAKYVQTHREYTDDVRLMVKNKLISVFGIKNVDDEYEWQRCFGTWKSNAIYRELYKTNLCDV